MNSIEIERKVIAGGDGPHLLIFGGVHGDEFEGSAAIRRLIGELDARTLRGRVTLVPVANMPAFVRGKRTAQDELDLARCFPGKENGSMTERLAYALSELIKTADYFIDLHSGGNAMWVSPLAGYALHSDAGVLRAQRRMARAFNLPIVWGTSPALEGRTLSFARDHNIPAIYAEWMGAGLCDARGVQAYVDGCLAVMSTLGMRQKPTPPFESTYIIEDNREGSGHLQINYPAPANGFFEPRVSLSSAISAGDCIGTVTDSLGQSVQRVISQQSGLVLCLRAFPRVEVGDCLAVILDVDKNMKQETEGLE